MYLASFTPDQSTRMPLHYITHAHIHTPVVVLYKKTRPKLHTMITLQEKAMVMEPIDGAMT